MAKTNHCGRFSRFANNKAGGVVSVVAVMLPILVGFGAIAIDMGFWYWDRRGMQSAADAAATRATWTLADGGQSADAITAGTASAATNGYSASNGSTVSVTVDSGARSATATITRPADLFLSRAILGTGGFNIDTVAVAGPRQSGPVCILALQASGTGITVNGGSGSDDIYGSNCSIQANSSAAAAINTNGSNALVQGTSVCANYSAPPSGNSAPNTIPAVFSCPPILDPFGRQLNPVWDGTSGNCPTGMADGSDKKNVKVSNNGELSEGCYIGNSISFQGAGEFEQGGVFFLYDTDIKMSGGAKDVTGQDITIFLYGSSTIDLEGAKSLTLSAKPSTDPDYPNILIAADASNSDNMVGGSNGDSKFGGNSTSNLEGWIYLPKQDMKMHGTGDFYVTNGGLIANTITRTGNGTVTVTSPFFDAPQRTTVMLLQ